MTLNEFTRHFERLCSGHRQKPTTERAEAVFRRIAHYSEGAWATAVDNLLLDSRLPSGEKLIEAVDQAADRERTRTRPAPFLPNRLPEDAPDRAYGQARLDLIKISLRERFGPRQIAEALLEVGDRFPAHADACAHEAVSYAEKAAIQDLGRRSSDVSGSGPPLNDPGAPRD